jgi:L-arabinose 1- dehydrogenase
MSPPLNWCFLPGHDGVRAENLVRSSDQWSCPELTRGAFREVPPLRTGVIGLGVIAPYFLDAIERNPDCVLTAVCDHDAGRLGGHNVAGYLDYREFLRREAIDLAVITLPNHLHEAAIEACLTSGVHVCCEKPLTLSRSSAQRLQAMAAERDRVLTVASHRRHNGHLVRLARQVSPARAAHVLVRYYEAIEEHSGDDAWYQDPARSGGGCLVDNGPNALDMARVVAGEMAVKATRLGEVLAGVEYRAQLLLLAAAGAAVTVDLRWDYPGQLKDVTVFLDDGSTLSADLLAGYQGLKGSLAHEYDGIIAHVVACIRGQETADDVTALAGLVEDAYELAGR